MVVNVGTQGLMINRLFQTLAQRWRNENALSDMTWAMAKTSQTFRDILIQFFRFSIDSAYPVEVERELTIDAGRLDFTIRNGERFFIVENKIYDGNYHIEQYIRTKEKGFAGLGLIINHIVEDKVLQVASQYGVLCMTWQDFNRELRHQLGKFSDEERPCVEAYLSYVLEVCKMVEVQRIDWTHLQSLYHFGHLVEQVLRELHHRKARFQPHRDGHSDGCYGKSFALWFEGDEKKYWPWVGVFFQDKEPSIYFAFREDWNPAIYQYWRGRQENHPRMRITEVRARREIQMVLNEKEFASFGESTLEAQRQILTEFAKSVIDEVYNACGAHPIVNT